MQPLGARLFQGQRDQGTETDADCPVNAVVQLHSGREGEGFR